MCAVDGNEMKVELRENIKICLNTGYGMLISSKSNSDYRNSVVLIHNGLELMMKLYLLTQNRFLVYEHLDHFLILSETEGVKENKKDAIKKKAKMNTISFSKCIDLMDCFLEISAIDVNNLNNMRNNCVHFEFVIYKSAIRKLLVSKTYPLIKQISNSLGEDISSYLDNSATLDAWCTKINDDIHSKYIQLIAAAKKHYDDDLTEKDRQEKRQYENYTVRKNDKRVVCPACENTALLERKVVYTTDEDEGIQQTTKSVVLKNLSCHYCGLVVNQRDQLLIGFSGEENTSTTTTISSFFSNYDCPDDYDCPSDCAPEDCPDDYDCPSDCAPEDCPDD